jgi:hypothetical protein
LGRFRDALERLANEALATFSAFADEFRRDSIEGLDDLLAAMRQRESAIQSHVDGNWKGTAKAAVRSAVEAVVVEGISDQAARAVALGALAVTEWLIIEPLLNTAATTLSTAIAPIVQTLNDLVEDSADAAEAFLDWQKDLEDQLIDDLSTMVIIPAADAAQILLDTVFPQFILNAIASYLSTRAEWKRLEREKAEQEPVLRQLEQRRNDTATQRNTHAHRSQMDVQILMPLAGRHTAYPSSMELTVRVTGITDEVIANPRSRRLQFRLNSHALNSARQTWTPLGGGRYLWTWRSASGSEFVDGINFFEVSWIRGHSDAAVSRRAVAFPVRRDVFYEAGILRISVDANPVGADVDKESVVVEWHGNNTLDMGGWMLRDFANHRYAFPEDMTLSQGHRVRVFTGGDPTGDSYGRHIEMASLHMGRGVAIWNNEGDLAELLDGTGTVVAAKGYGRFLNGR